MIAFQFGFFFVNMHGKILVRHVYHHPTPVKTTFRRGPTLKKSDDHEEGEDGETRTLHPRGETPLLADRGMSDCALVAGSNRRGGFDGRKELSSRRATWPRL